MCIGTGSGRKGYRGDCGLRIGAGRVHCPSEAKIPISMDIGNGVPIHVRAHRGTSGIADGQMRFSSHGTYGVNRAETIGPSGTHPTIERAG